MVIHVSLILVLFIEATLAHLMAFGAGTFFLGIGLVILLIFALAGRHDDSGEGCFGGIIVLLTMGLAAYFFILAL